MYDFDVFAKSVRVKNWYRSINKKLFCMKLFPLIFKFKFDCGKFSGLGCGCAQLYFELLILIFSNRDLNLRARGRWSSRPPSPAEPRAENSDVRSAWTPTTQRVIKYLFNYFNKFSNSAFSKQSLKNHSFRFSENSRNSECFDPKLFRWHRFHSNDRLFYIISDCNCWFFTSQNCFWRIYFDFDVEMALFCFQWIFRKIDFDHRYAFGCR